MKLCNHQPNIEFSVVIGEKPSKVWIICEKCEIYRVSKHHFEPGTSLKEKVDFLSEAVLRVKHMVQTAGVRGVGYEGRKRGAV